MPQIHQLEILRQGVKVWNMWRNQNRDVLIDLSGSDLSETDLSEVDLSGANLNHVNFFETHLNHAKITASKLHYANLCGASLRMADLSWAEFRNANLISANLLGANLADASLLEADLQIADLQSVNLERAILKGTNLRYVTLMGANLRAAHLEEADLSWANLSETTLTNATCGRTVFANTDFSHAVGLETLHHSEPSALGIESLFRTKTRLPDVFLRGCGVPEILLTYLPALLEKPIEFYSCFISYSHADKLFARRVHDTLQGKGIRCWLDEKQMNPGDDIYMEVDRGIKLWDKLLLCCSKSALTEKWWVDMEINKAFQKERDLMKERGQKVLTLIPLDLDGHLFKPEYQGGKADEIRSRIVADFTDWEHDNRIFEQEIERVIKALRTDGGKEPPPTPKL